MTKEPLARIDDAAQPARPAGARASADDLALVTQLLAGDEAAFTRVVRLYHGSLVRLAMVLVGNHAVAEEVVQDTWLAVLNGLPRFEGRSSLKTWIFTILTNRAKTHATRERRTVTFSDLSAAAGADEPAVDPDRFTSAGSWSTPPDRWEPDTPEKMLLRQEARTLIAKTMAGLPAGQRAVVTLGDIDGLDAVQVCHVLGLSETNRRVLLHRGRSKVRAALERYLAEPL